MKKKVIVLMMAVLLSVGAVSAQDKKDSETAGKGCEKPNFEQMDARAAERIADDLCLDDATSSKFSATYKSYREDLRKAKGDCCKQKGSRDKKMSDADVEKSIKEGFKTKRAVIDVQEKYYSEFRKYLSPKQIKKAMRVAPDGCCKGPKMEKGKGPRGPQGDAECSRPNPDEMDREFSR